MIPRVLLIGGTDSSGGAGLVRDIATVTRMGAESCVAVTAVTSQTDASVNAVHLVPLDDVAAQVRAAGRVDAVKIGMLGSAPVVDAVAGCLPRVPLVLDPVLASSSGHALLEDRGLDAMIAHLLPLTTLLTPNLPELKLLSRKLGLGKETDEETSVRALLSRGCKAVLVKGGHAEPGPHCEDRLYLPNGAPRIFSGPRYPTSLRGTGCQLASAIAVALGAGADPASAVSEARNQVASRFARRV